VNGGGARLRFRVLDAAGAVIIAEHDVWLEVDDGSRRSPARLADRVPQRGGPMVSAADPYASRTYRRNRRRVLDAAGWRCVRCGTPANTAGTQGRETARSPLPAVVT
jgi:hypothetical protein